jgi:hypothetical protein
MPNQQLWPQTTYPLVGDLQSTPGQQNVTVVGIQTVPVVPTTPLDQQSLIFQGTLTAYAPTYSPFNRSIQVNNVAMSDDYEFSVKFVDMEFQTNSSFAPNSKPVFVNGV